MPTPPLLRRLTPPDADQRLFAAFVGVVLIGGAAALLLDSPAWAALPVLVLGALVLALDWRWLYYLLLTTLAFSREISLPGGLSLDVPSEPLLVVLLGCVSASLLLGRNALPARFWTHPLVVLMGLALLWAVVSTLFSVNATKSIKYLLAKTWYLVPFVFGTLLVVRRPADVWRVAGCYAAGTAATVLYAAVRHASTGFTFATINHAVQPFYHNHVLYSVALALLVPYAFYAARATTHRGKRRLWYAAMVLFVLGISLSYTRASMLSLPVAAGFYLMMRLRQTRMVLWAVVLMAAGAAAYLVHQDNFMRYAPTFERTIFNGQNFEKHLEATYKLEDVSGMERVYRWVAAAHMIGEKPWVGSGPSTFYPEYKRFTIKSFRTYVSANPEHSTTHNYFLLMLAEQGIPGLGLFALLVGTALLRMERLYHRSTSAAHRRVVLAAGLSLVIIVFHLFLNELVEVDKIGSFFYLNLAVLMRAEEWIDSESLEV
ncbi:O-antigen ligase family protein [Hymenobacter jejuensis]|uniref:O-antigen ligase family protein n=1 Tax=Hymenobacter jejuensis TaxID=2502781 RepID=A0A5B7ZVC8_9BACT|nr:O-antigen ligase family protein [Hymenobacter jejuensis]QDA58797.1 O-antigen ligase family protein [Hymenobacter jejuensis]